MEEMTLQDICKIYDCPHTTAKDEGVGIPLVRTPNVGKGRLVLTNVHRVNSDVYKERTLRAIPEEDDIIIAREAPVGNAAIIQKKQKVCLGQRVVLLKPNKALVDPNFLVYYLLSNEVQHHLKIHANGAVVAHLNVADIRNLSVCLPSLCEQKKIGKSLKIIDDKIELNRRINDNLEHQAQALFKSWFVDFEPFKGEKFMESQLGMIPKGWKVGTLSDLLDIRYGKDHKKLNDGNIPVYGSGGIMRLADGILYNGESVLIPRKGTLNNVLYVNWPFWAVDTMFYSIEKVPNVAKYCHLLLSKLDLASMNSGSAVPSMTTDILNKIQVIVANQNVFSSFNECISSLYLKAKINLDENKRLSETRDLLLPKLMSGRLIINDLHS